MSHSVRKYETEDEQTAVKGVLEVLTFYEDHPIKVR